MLNTYSAFARIVKKSYTSYITQAKIRLLDGWNQEKKYIQKNSIKSDPKMRSISRLLRANKKSEKYAAAFPQNMDGILVSSFETTGLIFLHWKRYIQYSF